MTSAYYIFKRPDLIAKGEPFLESVFGRFQAREHYTPNLAQEINLSRIQRQLIADKGSFDDGLPSMSRFNRASRAEVRISGPSIRAALRERQINVDRVGSDNGQPRDIVAHKRVSQCCQRGESPRTLVRADSYSRYCLGVITSRLGKYRTTSNSQVEHRGRELEQWDKPLCASVPALRSSIGSDKRDELSFNGRGLALPGY